MRIEIVPERPNKKPWLTAEQETGWRKHAGGIPNGTDDEILAEARKAHPQGRNFVVKRERQLRASWGDPIVYVEYEEQYNRWFVEVSTAEELLAIMEAQAVGAYVEGNVITFCES